MTAQREVHVRAMSRSLNSLLNSNKKTVSLVQVNFQMGPKELNSYHLPYTAGCLWAYVQSQPDLQDFQLNQFIWRRDNIDSLVPLLLDDYVVGFSTYVWNLQYNLALARKLKASSPNIFIVFGGPEPAVSDANIFHTYSFIDAIVKNEGEITFAEILRNLPDLLTVPGLIFNQNGRAIDNGRARRIDDLSVLPSPYTQGCFDNLISTNPDVKWAATLETNRGCPYACTFCDWGSLTLSKVKKFNEEKVFAELEWMAQNNVDFVSIADANFGIFPERDRRIIDKFVYYQKKYQAPRNIIANFAKNQNKEVIDIVECLIKNTLYPTTGLKISLQSLHEPTLDIIKRKNLKINNISEIIEIGKSKNIPIGTELILGLPGETFESWRQNYWKLLEVGIHEDIDVYYCQIIENAEINQIQKQIYNIDTAKIYDYFSPWADNTGESSESLNVVRSTVDMSFDNLIQASLFSWDIFTWHVGGYSNIITRFLRMYTNTPFDDIYTQLLSDAQNHHWYLELRQQQMHMLLDWFQNGRCTLATDIDDLKLFGNTIIFHTRMLLAAKPQLAENWFNFMDQYLDRYALPHQLKRDVMLLQRNQVVAMHERDSYPRYEQFSHTVWEFVNNDGPLTNNPCVLKFDFPEPKMTDLEFIERIFWSRKRRFGKTWIYPQ